MLKIAFKEWASVCRALALGHQSVILRKGGIADVGGLFKPEHDKFWLYPTHFHEQQQAGLKPEWLHLIPEAEANKPEAGQLRFTHWADVQQVDYVTELSELLKRSAEHVLNDAIITQRFNYRTPGLYVLQVQVHEAEPLVVPEHPEYAGCKTWVELV